MLSIHKLDKCFTCPKEMACPYSNAVLQGERKCPDDVKEKTIPALPCRCANGTVKYI